MKFIRDRDTCIVIVYIQSYTGLAISHFTSRSSLGLCTIQFQVDQGMVPISKQVSVALNNMLFTCSWCKHDTLLFTELYSLLADYISNLLMSIMADRIKNHLTDLEL